MQLRPKQAIDFLTTAIKAKLVPFLEGSPGIGKSGIVHQIAKTYNLKVIDLRLSQCDPTDLSGFPTFQEGRAHYAPMETFPIEGDKIPAGYAGWLLFLDELNSAPMAVQASAYKLILDRMVGMHNLHPNVAIIAAGNKEDDNAIVQPISTALQSRMVWGELEVNSDDWIEWAETNNIDHRITSYIKFKPTSLYTFRPDHTDKTYACPRTWEFANRVRDSFDSPIILPMLAGTLSEGVAREFIGFCKIYKSLPTAQDMMNNPTGITIPVEPSTLFAISGSVASHVNADTADTLMKFIERLPSEFQTFTLKEVVRRNHSMISHKALRGWISKNAAELTA